MAWLLSTLLIASVAAFSADEVREAAGEVLQDDRYQTALPGEDDDTTAEAPPPPPRQPRERDPVSDISSALMWVLLAVIVGVLVVWVVTQFRSLDRYVPDRGQDLADDEVSSGRSVEPLADVAALARAGRFDEAVHALLLRALGILRAARPSGLPDFLTSREVLQNVPLGAADFDALSGLIETVEHSLFGGRVVGRADYERCSGQFDTFASQRGGRPAG